MSLNSFPWTWELLQNRHVKFHCISIFKSPNCREEFCCFCNKMAWFSLHLLRFHQQFYVIPYLSMTTEVFSTLSPTRRIWFSILIFCHFGIQRVIHRSVGQKAIDEELQALAVSQAWKVVLCPSGIILIGCIWVYTLKPGLDAPWITIKLVSWLINSDMVLIY